MIHSVFSVYDQKAGAHLPPFVLPRVEMAQRVFADCCNSNDHQFSKHPEDYSLWHHGSWDDANGGFIPHKRGAKNLGNGLQYLQSLTLKEVNGHGQVGDATPVLASPESGDSA